MLFNYKNPENSIILLNVAQLLHIIYIIIGLGFILHIQYIK